MTHRVKAIGVVLGLALTFTAGLGAAKIKQTFTTCTYLAVNVDRLEDLPASLKEAMKEWGGDCATSEWLRITVDGVPYLVVKADGMVEREGEILSTYKSTYKPSNITITPNSQYLEWKESR